MIYKYRMLLKLNIIRQLDKSPNNCHIYPTSTGNLYIDARNKRINIQVHMLEQIKNQEKQLLDQINLQKQQFKNHYDLMKQLKKNNNELPNHPEWINDHELSKKRDANNKKIQVQSQMIQDVECHFNQLQAQVYLLNQQKETHQDMLKHLKSYENNYDYDHYYNNYDNNYDNFYHNYDDKLYCNDELIKFCGYPFSESTINSFRHPPMIVEMFYELIKYTIMIYCYLYLFAHLLIALIIAVK